MTTLTLPACLRENEPLAAHTWYRLGGPARWFAMPADERELADVLAFCDAEGIEVYPLGLGANLLVGDDGVDGCVVRLAGRFWERVEVDGSSITVGGGVSLAKLTKQCERLGLSGFECMAGIPGTVGGGLRMNAGGRFGDIASTLRDFRVLDQDGTARTISKNDGGFGYRTSSFDAPFVVSATFDLVPSSPEVVAARTREVWTYKRQSQPLGGRDGRSCGCAFKNPPGDSAGRLIDTAGLKGLAVGGARVSELHANFITADASCRSRDVRHLIALVRRRVRQRHGVRLHTEVQQWPMRRRRDRALLQAS
ncbi:MAG: UDP-N-acetylmuramate dehydrogenase [Planctomycetota bacterium]